MPKNIVLKGSPIRKEGLAAGVITPGALVDFDATGGIVVHATAAGNAAKAFAVEEDFMGNNIDKTYTSGNQVQYVIAGSGDEIYGLLKAGNEVAKGNFLVSGGDGTVQKFAALASTGTVDAIQSIAIVGRALEAVTTTNAVKRIRIEVI